MKKVLFSLILFAHLSSFAQPPVPDTETFDFLVVRAAIAAGTVARVDRVTKSAIAENVTVSCNGYKYPMVWSIDATNTIANFIGNYGDAFGAVILSQTGVGSMTFTALVPGVDFAAAAITGTGNEAVNIVPNNPGTTNSLVAAFNDATTAKFDPHYYPKYMVTGSANSLLNFRNYGGTWSYPIPDVIGAKDITRTKALLKWEMDATMNVSGFYFDVALDAGFQFILPGYTNVYISYDTWSLIEHGYWVENLAKDVVHYYRVKAVFSNGQSSYYSSDIGDQAPFRLAPNWWLPSLAELSGMMYLQAVMGLDLGFATGFINKYWSSSEHCYATLNGICNIWGGSSAIIVGSSAGQWIDTKNNSYRVRATRSFESTYEYNVGDPVYVAGIISGYVYASQGPLDSFGSYKYWVCPVFDLSNSIWSNIHDYNGASGEDMGSGRTNTQIIITQPGHTTSAAKLCDDWIYD